MRRILTFALLALAATAASADETVSHSFLSSTPAASVRSIVVDVPAGSIRVINGKSREIRISGIATRRFDSWSRRAENQRIVDDVSAETSIHDEVAVIRRHFGPNAQSWRSEKFTTLETTVEVPAGVSVSFETSFGEIHMDGTFGDIDVDLRAGEVHIDTPRSGVRVLNASCRLGEVHTSTGGEMITREGFFPGRTHFENPSGKTVINAHVTAGEVHVNLH